MEREENDYDRYFFSLEVFRAILPTTATALVTTPPICPDAGNPMMRMIDTDNNSEINGLNQ